MDKKTAGKIYKILEKEYSEAMTALVHKNALQLLVATILSAQCTDVRVNIVTKDLFKKYKKASDFAKAKPEILEKEMQERWKFVGSTKKQYLDDVKKILTNQYVLVM